MEGEMDAARIGLERALAFGFSIVGPDTLPDELSLWDPNDPQQLRVALEPSKDCRLGRVVLKPEDQYDPSQCFDKVVVADDGTFELWNRRSGLPVAIGHLSRFLEDPIYFHPRALRAAARWKATVIKNGTGEFAAGVVCSSALQSELLVLKVAQPGDEVGVDDDGGAAAGDQRTTTTSTRRTSPRWCCCSLFNCF